MRGFFSPLKGRPEERMIGPMAGAIAQIRRRGNPNWGRPNPCPSRPRHRVRPAGESTASRAGGVRLLACAPPLVREEQEPRLRPRVVARGVGHNRGRDLQPHRLRAQALECCCQCSQSLQSRAHCAMTGDGREPSARRHSTPAQTARGEARQGPAPRWAFFSSGEQQWIGPQSSISCTPS